MHIVLLGVQANGAGSNQYALLLSAMSVLLVGFRLQCLVDGTIRSLVRGRSRLFSPRCVRCNSVLNRQCGLPLLERRDRSLGVVTGTPVSAKELVT